MNRLIMYKRALASFIVCIAAAAVLTAGSAAADSDYEAYYYAEEEDTGDAFDVSVYTDRLQEIAQKQAEIEEKLNSADDTMQDETEVQRLILEKISTINEKADIINSYMTQLEMKIATEEKNAAELKEEIDEGIDAYKKRLRAMYIAGDMTYTEVILNSGDFYDILMRSELLKRVSEYDAKTLDSLVEKKALYDEKLKELETERLVYDDQNRVLDKERAELAELYNSSSEMKQLLKEQKEQLAEEQRTFENEIYSFEGILDDLLKGTYSSDADEIFRLQTELKATSALSDLHTAIREREKQGQVINAEECRYDFKWPVPKHYYVSSGVGARWGSYHTGIDIPGESGIRVNASEAGTVVRTNNGCIHNYGKDGSCGCGGGYGNFVIIDHGNGFLTLYGHLTQTSVEVGDKVKQGDQIGLMGSTGFSTGTHLHFELRYEGYITNPATFVTY